MKKKKYYIEDQRFRNNKVLICSSHLQFSYRKTQPNLSPSVLPFSIFNFQYSTPLAECTGQDGQYYHLGNPQLQGILQFIPHDHTERDLYFYHSDHLGSSSFISDASGTAIQHLQYLPFGETFVDQRNSSYNTPFKFSAKEKDDETGYSYFGARYYWPEVSVWLSVDPMADERSWLSPYNYCQWNPVGRTDPNGELDIGYTIDKDGNIEEVDNTGGDKFDVLFKKEDYDAGKRDYDETGKKPGLKVNDRNILTSLSEVGTSTEGYGIRKGYSKNRNEAFKVFHFAANNSNVEWTIKGYSRKNGENSFLLATFMVDYCAPGTFSVNENIKEEIFDIHSHLRLDGLFGASPADMRDYYRIKHDSGSKAYHAVYDKENQSLYKYTTNSSQFIRKIGNNPKRYSFGAF